MKTILSIIFLLTSNFIIASTKVMPNFNGVYRGTCSVGMPLVHTYSSCVATFEIVQKSNIFSTMEINIEIDGQSYFDLYFSEHIIVGNDLIDPRDSVDVGNITSQGFNLERSEDNKLDFKDMGNNQYQLIGVSTYYGVSISAKLQRL